MPCVLWRRHYAQHATAKANPENWSEASKRSHEYEAKPTSYFDEYYWCKYCGAPSIFRGEDQKIEYEIRKTRIYWKPTLCSSCTETLKSIRVELSEFLSRWEAEHTTLSLDREFLERWLRKLEEFVRLTKRDHGSIQMIQNLLTRLP